MKPSSPRLLSIFASSFLVLSAIPSTSRAEDRPERDVRIVYVQGDVRLSRGDGKRIDLDKGWEEAQSGALAEQGYALSTGDGRAEIDFENSSSVFLAENSLLLFNEISAAGKRFVTRMTLATGTATSLCILSPTSISTSIPLPTGSPFPLPMISTSESAPTWTPPPSHRKPTKATRSAAHISLISISQKVTPPSSAEEKSSTFPI